MLRAVAESGRTADIALYTGNDDNIIVDLLTEYAIPTARGMVKLQIVGGLLGQWACWTHRAVEHFAQCKALRNRSAMPAEMLTLAAQLTDCNAAIFDATHQFVGVIPGVNEVLRRQGLMASTLSLKVDEQLSPGQLAAIDRVQWAYPHLNDNAFVQEHLDDWLN